MKPWPMVTIVALFSSLWSSTLAMASDKRPGKLAVHDENLVLNGYGEREHWWTDVYRCALYLPRKTDAIHFIRAPSTAKAIRIRVLFGEIPDQMPKSWREIFSEELTRELLGRLKKAYRVLQDDDTLTFAYSPGKGTEIWVNGEVLLSDPGHQLMLELLDQWLGNRPVSKNLKRLLLNSSGT